MDFVFEGKINDKIKAECMKLVKRIPELKYIEEKDFAVVIIMSKAPVRHGRKTLADMSYITHWLKQWIEYLTDEEFPKYVLRVYPTFLKLPTFAPPPNPSKVAILIHELYHISPPKRGVRPHTGFGDEVIYRIYRKRIKR